MGLFRHDSRGELLRPMGAEESRIKSFFNTLLGKPLRSQEQEEQKLGVWGGVPALGLDGLGSASYGPEAALTILLPLGVVGLHYIGYVIAPICVLLIILYVSYLQTISAYPSGGGAYTVAKVNLGKQAGLMAAAALIVDYILNAAVGISAGIGALVSALPSLQPYTLELCLAALGLITLMNLRGVRESSFVFGIPTYIFIGSLLATLAIGTFKTVTSGGHAMPVDAPPVAHASTTGVTLWLLVRAFASGCTAMTGVEAVSNGITIFSKPREKNAKRTLTVICGVLFVLLIGVAY